MYRFHLKGHRSLLADIKRLELVSEARARAHFSARYETAKDLFLSGSFGQQLVQAAPDVPARFDAEHAATTWTHFLNGVYGVCTRDGLPETVFLKQVGVMFIEQMIADGPGSLDDSETALLARAVSFLDTVESGFAPHEAAHVSRQRCIVDVNANFLSRDAA